LPVQSGSDRILKAMRRGYDSTSYRRRVEVIKNSKRKLALTSDIIVGFPGETEADFEATLKLIEDCEYDGVYFFKYSQRRGTPAAQLRDDVSPAEKTRRFLALEQGQRKSQQQVYRAYLGRKVSVLVEGESFRSASDLTGHSTCHKVVNFAGPVRLVGQITDVIITEVKPNSLYGRSLEAERGE
jgi:tRNA-2-methylthio-N6-dimethylallyladenosine synthase